MLHASPLTALAGEYPPVFDIFTELEIKRIYWKHQWHKALAVGLNNNGWTAYGYQSLGEARKAALEGCESYVRKMTKTKGKTQCQLVMENDKFVWPGPRPQPISSNFLPQPDRPLKKARTFGDIDKAKAILLAVHGCDGPGNAKHPWVKGWYNYFRSKGFAVVQPNSLADPHPLICGFGLPIKRTDPVLRLRIAQTLRTLANLRTRFPDKPIYLWGHSEGGNVVQLMDYDVKGIIITGADCITDAYAPREPVFHVFGGRDPYSPLGDKRKPLTEEKVRAFCGYSNEGKKQFAIVPKGDHWVKVTVPAVSQGLDRFLGKSD